MQVLLIEDSIDDAFLTTYELERHDEPVAVTRVDTAPALEAALAAQHWDIVISDYRMPFLDGLAALGLVRRHDRQLPFILVSNTIGPNLAADLLRLGATAWMAKSETAKLLPVFQRELCAVRALRGNKT